MRLRCLVTPVAFLMLVCAHLYAEEAPKLERIEWSDIWIVNADTTAYPRVLLVGDSIVKGYYNPVEHALSERASCARYATSMFLSNPDYLAELSLILNRYAFDVIHINNGLHGWDYSEAEYEQGLHELLAVITRCAPKAKVIWCMTTPMRVEGNVDQINSEMNNRVIERNRIAAEVMRKNGIAVNDLYEEVIGHPEYFSKDGVHFNSDGQAIQGEKVAAIIETHLAKE